MQPREICDRQLLPFRLSVRVDDEPVLERTVRPAGARADRPTYVFEEIALAPGAHQLHVEFTTERPGGAPGAQAGGLRLETAITAAPGRIVLVTDRDGRLTILAPD
jgi:hypothetical protein